MKFKKGDKVTYKPKLENGIVKSFNPQGKPFVVYNCAGNWDNYTDYIAACTDPNDLELGWDWRDETTEEFKRCKLFLYNNGWICDDEQEFFSFYREGSLGVDINNEEIVIIADVGDILHLPTNYYTLVGVLLEYRQIACGYKSVKLSDLEKG